MEFNSNYYNHTNSEDIQSLLKNNKAQIVTKEFFEYLVNNGYNYASGITFSQLLQLQKDWDENKNSVKGGLI